MEEEQQSSTEERRQIRQKNGSASKRADNKKKETQCRSANEIKSAQISNRRCDEKEKKGDF